MQHYRLVVPALVAFIALAGAGNFAFASGQPLDEALAGSAAPSQEAAGGHLDGNGAGDVRPVQSGPRQRLAALCYRLLDSDREAPNLRARCAQVFGDDAPDPAAVCRELAARGADAEIVRRCVQRIGDGIDGADFCRRIAQSEGNDAAKQRCRAHFGGDDADPAQICRRAAQASSDAASDVIARCRAHFGEGDAGDQLRRRLGGNVDGPARVRPDELRPARVSRAQ